MNSTISYHGTLVIETCCNCHIAFAMPQDLNTELRRTRLNFFCPKGHSQHYIAESNEARLKRELETAQRNLTAEKCTATNLRNSLQEQQREASRQYRLKRVAQKKLKQVCVRVAAGVCPCCNRTFQDLARHMAGKHPGFKSEVS